MITFLHVFTIRNLNSAAKESWTFAYTASPKLPGHDKKAPKSPVTQSHSKNLVMPNLCKRSFHPEICIDCKSVIRSAYVIISIIERQISVTGVQSGMHRSRFESELCHKNETRCSAPRRFAAWSREIALLFPGVGDAAAEKSRGGARGRTGGAGRAIAELPGPRVIRDYARSIKAHAPRPRF